MSNPTHSPVYSAVYSGVAVFEMNCRSVAVMRRRDDSFLNATQILKVAGVDKGRRTKILEREVQVGHHEKVQGGYGKYQGTWIPFERGVEIARQYNVEELLRPLLEHVAGPDDDFDTPKKKRPNISKPKSSHHSHHGYGGDFDEIPRLATRKNSSSTGVDYGNSYGSSSALQFSSTTTTASAAAAAVVPPQHRPPVNNNERYRAILMSVFLNHDTQKLPDLLTNPNPPSDLDIDLVIDDQGHSALHWAAALARINILELLLGLGADPRRVNFNGESALVRAVLVTNNFDNDTFYNLLALLHTSIDIMDKKGRTLFHHIALTAGIKGRVQASRYYLDVLLDMMKRNKLDVSAMIDKQDKNGDTALNIACRINNGNLVEQLLRAGACPDVPNRSGLRPMDFGLEDQKLASLFVAAKNGELGVGGGGGGIPGSVQQSAEERPAASPTDVSVFGVGHSDAYRRYTFSSRGKEMTTEFEGVISHLEAEGKRKDTQIQEAVAQIRNISGELSSSRRVIQQLSLRVSELQARNLSYENQLGIVGEGGGKSDRGEAASEVEKLRAEVEKLRAIVVANGLATEDIEPRAEFLTESTGVDGVDVDRASELVAKALNVPLSQVSGSGSLVGPLLDALESEKSGAITQHMGSELKSMLLENTENDAENMMAATASATSAAVPPAKDVEMMEDVVSTRPVA